MAGGRLELAMEPMAIGLVSLNSNSETLKLGDTYPCYERVSVAEYPSCYPVMSLVTLWFNGLFPSVESVDQTLDMPSA